MKQNIWVQKIKRLKICDENYWMKNYARWGGGGVAPSFLVRQLLRAACKTLCYLSVSYFRILCFSVGQKGFEKHLKTQNAVIWKQEFKKQRNVNTILRLSTTYQQNIFLWVESFYYCSSTRLGGKKCHSREGAELQQIKCQMGL